jgi:hypothetical protein
MNAVEVEIQEPSMKLDDVETVRNLTSATEEKHEERETRNLEQLRLNYVNAEEKKLLIGTCQDYQDVFYLSGDILSSVEANDQTNKHQTLQTS